MIYQKPFMIQNTILLGSAMTVTLPDGWADMTSELSSGPEFTLARPTLGSGALQFSIALFESGVPPMPSSSDLLQMARDFGASRKFGPALDEVTVDGSPGLAAATFHVDADFIRVWYLSDGWNFALVTYVCEWNQRDLEQIEAEAIVRTLRFVKRRPP